jgi:hypothetical protein
MEWEIVSVIIRFLTLAINITTMILMFPRRYSWIVSLGSILLFTAAYTTLLPALALPSSINFGISGIAFLPLMMLLFRGMLLHIIFAFFLQYQFTLFQLTMAQKIIGEFLETGSPEYAATVFFTVIVLYAGYVFLMFRFGRSLSERLFAQGRPSEWVLYTLGGIFSYAVLAIYRNAPGGILTDFLILPFILWSFSVLCFAIVNTHEKTKRRVESEFANSIISSGRDYYEKMNTMQDTLRILRHDVKYHVSAVREMLRSGNAAKLDAYLSDVESLVTENELPVFCKNAVVNALLASYAERCKKSDIHYSFEAALPEVMTIPNYEMCVVLGNLLENAVAACGKPEGGRRVNLNANFQNGQFAVVVENSFDGLILSGNGQPVSGKKEGGFGLRSVRAVTERYGGKLITEWDPDTFMAYAIMNVQTDG